MIEGVAHSRPPTCPWRAFREPLVHEVLELSAAFDPPNLGAVLGQDPPALLVDAVLHYQSALKATWADDSRLRREKEAARKKR